MAQKFRSLYTPLEDNGKADSKRPKSTIEFPYGDEDMAKDVAKTIFHHGGQQGTIHQLAAWLNHDSLTSGAFRLKYTTARTFGLIDVNHEEVKLTELGRKIVDENLERQARVEAFLHVPLYKALFEKYKGYTLPNDVGLEQEMVTLGVTLKQSNKARQAFQRSAQQAGFFEQGRNKLVLPSGLGGLSASTGSRDTRPLNTPPAPIMTPSPQYDHGGSGGGGDNREIQALQGHPLIQGLFQELASVGTPWTQAQHDEWLELAKLVLKRIHPVSQ